jgi:hypoxanthine phosphoribosyltransferase
MKQVYLSYHDIHTDCIKLAKLIKKKYKPQKLILISRGGLIPGSIIANYLGIQDIDVIALKTYADRKKKFRYKNF